jgi:hypothetical protein
VVNDADGWTVRGSSQLGPPIDITTRRAEIRYDAAWNARALSLEGVSRGQEVQLRTSFANGTATSEITAQGTTERKTDTVTPDTIVLPNTFLGSYAVLARRLQGLVANAELHAYIAPQMEVPIRVVSVATERIETARTAIPASRYSLKVVNPPPAGEIDAGTAAADEHPGPATGGGEGGHRLGSHAHDRVLAARRRARVDPGGGLQHRGHPHEAIRRVGTASRRGPDRRLRPDRP